MGKDRVTPKIVLMPLNLFHDPRQSTESGKPFRQRFIPRLIGKALQGIVLKDNRYTKRRFTRRDNKT